MENFQDNVASAFIMKKAAEAGDSLSGDLVLRESNFFFTKKITGASGNYPILRQSDQFLEGIRNIDKAAIPAGEHVAVKGIQLRVALDVANSFTEGDAVFKSVSTSGPGDLLNATLRIKVGTEVIVEEKIEDLLTETATEGLGGNIYLPFKNWKYLQGGRTMEAFLIVPEGETITASSTNNHFIKVKFVGTAAKLR